MIIYSICHCVSSSETRCMWRQQGRGKLSTELRSCLLLHSCDENNKNPSWYPFAEIQSALWLGSFWILFVWDAVVVSAPANYIDHCARSARKGRSTIPYQTDSEHQDGSWKFNPRGYHIINKFLLQSLVSTAVPRERESLSTKKEKEHISRSFVRSFLCTMCAMKVVYRLRNKTNREAANYSFSVSKGNGVVAIAADFFPESVTCK